MPDILFQLIKVSLGNADRLSRTLSKDEWETLYDLAEKHAIVGICFMGIQRLPKEQLPDKFVLMEWMGQTERIRTRNAYMDECCLKLQDRLERDGQQYCILKGQGVATYYGNLASYRQSGDIDVWISGGFDKVVGYVNGISSIDNVYNHHVELNIFDDVCVEVHFKPIKQSNFIVNRKLCKWFDTQEYLQMQNLIPFADSKMHVPTIEFNVVYLLLHMYRHLLSEGIGLRHIIDYYIILKALCIDEAAKQNVRNLVSSFGIEKFACGVMWILCEIFGMKLSLALWKPNERHGRFILDEIMQMGNFGHSDERYQLSSKDSHIKRYFQMTMSKWRFFWYYPSECIWQPIEIFMRFFEIRFLKNKVRSVS